MTSSRVPVRRALAFVALAALLFTIRAASAGIWSTRASLPAPRYAHAAVELNGIIHVVGGALSSFTCSFEASHVAYDPADGVWVSKAPMHVARVHPGAAVLSDGAKKLLYVVGGSTGCGPRTATVEAYDPDSDTWTFKASMPEGARSTMGIAVVDNILYVIAGQQSDSGPNAGMTAIVEAYNPVSNTWTARQSLPGVRYAMATGAIDGLIYVAGGGNDVGGLNTLYAYDPATNLWTPRTPMPAGHFASASAVANSRLYVIGGYVGSGFSGAVDVYNPASNAWTTGAPLPVVRTEGAAATVSNIVYTTGGTDGAAPEADVYALSDPIDTDAPATIATPSVPANGNGWNNTNVTVSLQATDGGSGVDSIVYSTSGAQTAGATVAGSMAVVSITAEGATTLTYHAIDAAGNVESDHTLAIRIDKTAPLVGAPSNIVSSATASAGAAISFTILASDPLSGVVGTQVQPLLSGQIFPLGTTHETITVSDAAGNGALVGFDVTIVPGRPNISITGGTFVADGNQHPATATATDNSGRPIDGSLNIAYAPGGSAPSVAGRYSAATTFISSDPAFVSVSPWTTKATDIARSFASGGAIGGKLYVVGVGSLGAASPAPFQTSEFNPSTNTWSVKSNAPLSRNQAGSGVIESKLLVAGGCVFSDCNSTTNALTAYDAATDTWSSLASMPFARNNTAAAAIGTKLYVAGGANPFTATNTLQIYDRGTNTWTTGAALPVGVWQAAGAALNGKLYVMGGLDGANVYRDIVQVYDPQSNTWTTAASMRTARISLAATVVNGRIYAVGGSPGPAGVTPAIESYDPAADAWTIEPSLPTARYALVTGAIDGVLYATSGAASSFSASGLTEALDLSLTTHITITAPVALQSITVSPSSATLAPGGTQSFAATGHFSDGSSRVLMTAGDGPNVHWESANPSIASVNEFGLVQANGPGTVTIRASAGSVICGGAECATVTVQDTTPPLLSLPANMTVEAFSSSGQQVTWFASATDNVDGLRDVTCNPASGSLFPFGTSTVSCSASDLSGNIGTGTFTVTVADTNPPWLALPNGTQTREATGPGGAVVTYFASANDSVDGPLTPACVPASGSQFRFGSTTVNCSVTDAHGNGANGSFTVLVQDTTAPFLGLPNSPQTRQATNAAGAIVTYTATANDTVDGSMTPLCTPASGSQFAFGPTPVNCSATDAHGNTRTASFTINVVDTNGPSVFTPGFITAQATSPAGAVVTFNVTANDQVDGARPVTCTPPSGATFPLGFTQVACTASDTRGNTGTGSLGINVVAGAPVITIVSPSSESLSIGSAEVLVDTWSPVGVYAVYVNGYPMQIRSVNGAVWRWGTFVPASTGGPLNLSVTAYDYQGRIGTASRTIDNDGIAAVVDRNRTTFVDESGIYSSDFNNGPTAGTVVRSGGAAVSVFPRNNTIAATLGSSGSAQVYACGGTPKYVQLNSPNEGVDITCVGPTTMMAKAYGPAGTTIEFMKQTTGTQYVTQMQCYWVSGGFFFHDYSVCYPVQTPVTYTYWYSIPLAPGQSASTGSPVVASPDNTDPIHVTMLQMADDGSEIPVGSFDLDPGESADVNVTPGPNREDVLAVTALKGTVSAEVGGITHTIAEGQTAALPMDLTPPALRVPANMTVNANTTGGAVVPFLVTAIDAVDGAVPVTCAPASGSVFPVGTATVACSTVDAHGNPAEASFTVTVLSTAQTVQGLLTEVDSFQQGQRLLANVLSSINAGNTSAACGQLGGFIDMVTAQAGKTLTASDAETLIRNATDARTSLGCP